VLLTTIKDLRGLSNDALIAQLNELTLDGSIERRKIASTGVASKTSKARAMRRTRAQILTLLNQRGVKL
jgi:ribosomal protein L29